MKITKYEWSKIDHHIGLVKRDGEKLRNKIHALGVSILQHWLKNPKDAQSVAEKMQALVKASPYHSASFAQWVSLSGMQWSDETKAFFLHKDQKIKAETFTYCRDNPFWEVSPPPEPKPLNMAEVLQKVIDKARKHQKKPVQGDVISEEAVRRLIDIVSLMESDPDDVEELKE